MTSELNLNTDESKLDPTPVEKYLTPRTRKWLYQVSLSMAPLLAGIGIMEDGLIQNILVIIAALLTVSTNGMAIRKMH